MATYEKPIVVGNTDTYTYTVDSAWLGNETIASHTVTVGAGLTKNASSVSGNVIGVSITPTASGGQSLHFEWETSGGRTDCVVNYVKVRDNC